MAYIEANLVVDGAQDENRNFAGVKEFWAWFQNVQAEFIPEGQRIAEVFVINHEHDEDVEECACVQYLQDHNPLWKNREA